MDHEVKQLFSFEKIILLLGVGFPGGTKFLFALIIKSQTGLEGLGLYASDLNIGLILSAVTGIGFSVILMNRLPRMKDTIAQNELIGRVTISATLFSILMGIVLVPLKHMGLVEAPWTLWLFLTGYSNYIVYRHYLMALKKYTQVLLWEVILLALIGSGLYLFSYHTNPLLIHAALLLVLFGGINIWQGSYHLKKLFSRPEISSGLGFGMANLSSSFLAYISVPLARQLLGPLYAGFLGVINPLIQITVLIPRSLSNYYLPELAREERYSRRQKHCYNTFHRINALFLATVVILFAVTGFLFQHLFPGSELLLANSYWVLLLLLINLFFTQISLPGFNVIAAWDRSALSFKINLVTLMLFFLFSSMAVLWGVGGFKGFMTIYILMILLNIGRWSYLKGVVQTRFNKK